MPTTPSTLVPRPTTEVPAPGSGNVNQTVASVAESTAPARPLSSPATLAGQVTAKISSIKAITGKAHGPGEISGPALEITIALDNSSATAIDLSGVGVTLTGSDGGPTATLAGTPASPFSGTLVAGGNASATYVFTIATDKRRPITLSLSYSAGTSIVVFTGNAP